MPRALEITFKADPALNPDSGNRPAPVVVRVYTLRATVAFQSADFFALYDKDQAILADDLVSREELQIRPGEVIPLRRELKPEMRFIATVAAFRDLERSGWRAVLRLPDPPAPTPYPPKQPVPVPVTIELGPRSVSIQGR